MRELTQSELAIVAGDEATCGISIPGGAPIAKCHGVTSGNGGARTSGGFAMLKHQKQQGDNAFWLPRQRRFWLKIAGTFFN